MHAVLKIDDKLCRREALHRKTFVGQCLIIISGFVAQQAQHKHHQKSNFREEEMKAQQTSLLNLHAGITTQHKSKTKNKIK